MILSTIVPALHVGARIRGVLSSPNALRNTNIIWGLLLNAFGLSLLFA
jgi:threonine/homoserine/homoserine lactone efflux protein